MHGQNHIKLEKLVKINVDRTLSFNIDL